MTEDKPGWRIWYIHTFEHVANSLSPKELLQINATLIAGVLIFLALSSAYPFGDAFMPDFPPIDTEGMPPDFKAMVADQQLLAAQLNAEGHSAVRAFDFAGRAFATFGVVLTLSISTVLSLMGFRFVAIYAFISALVLLMANIAYVANVSATYAFSSQSSIQEKEDQLAAKTLEIKKYIEDYKAKSQPQG